MPIILGGTYSTLYPEHASNNSGADFIYKGSLNESLNFALYTFGYRLKRKGEPAPYYRLNLYDEYPFAPLLTGTGCPFKCSYCASGILTDRYQKRLPEDVLAEIGDLYDRGVRDYAFYDDALLFNADEHIKPILRGIVAEGFDIRLHSPNGLHARFIDEELAGLMKSGHFSTIRLSLETVDTVRQQSTGGKVNSCDVARAVGYLKQQGFTKKEIGVYLMYGLPGQDLEEVREGVGFLKTLNVRINLTEFSPVKGTKSWGELVESGIIDDNLDPLLTNNTIFSYLYSGCDFQELSKIRLDVKEYNKT